MSRLLTPTRRKFIAGASTSLAMPSVARAFRAGISNRDLTMTSVSLGAPVTYGTGTSNFIAADTFNNTWGADDTINMTSCDCGTWNQTDWTFGVNGSNVLMSTLSGFDPTTAVGSQLNLMVDNLGHSGQNAQDNCGWKASGLIDIAGVQYMSGVRQQECCGDTQEQHLKASLFMSSDNWATYMPQPGPCPDPVQPVWCTPGNMTFMWTTFPFGSPTPIQYGKGYQGQTIHRSNQYVYMMFPEGNFNCDEVRIGRCLISDMSALDTTKYSYYTGGDGMLDANWSFNQADALVIISDPGHISMTSINFMSYFQEYCMVQWYRKSGYSLPGPQVTQFFFWKSKTPWGPWTKFYTSPEYSELVGNYAPYQPTICVKSVATDGGRNIVLLTPGDVGNNYTLLFVPCQIST